MLQGYRAPLRRTNFGRPGARPELPSQKIDPVKKESQHSPLELADIIVSAMQELRGMHETFLQQAPNIPGLIEQHVGKIKQGPPGPPGSPGIGIDGRSPEVHHVVAEVIKLLKLPQDGRPGRPGPAGKSVTAEEVMETLISGGFLEPKHIKGLEDRLSFINRVPVQRLGGHGGHGGGGGDTVITFDLSSQCTGANKVFVLPKFSKIVQLIGSDAPLIYRPNIDYTWLSGNTMLTLTAAVNAPSLGATLIALYVF